MGKNIDKKAKYGLASAWSRSSARVVDLVLVYSLIFCIVLLIMWTDPAVISFEDIKNLSIEQSWRYFLIGVCCWGVFFIYFILVPYVWNGKTPGKWLLKLRTWNLIQTKSFFVNLLRKEFFLWIIIMSINIILSVVLMFKNPADAKMLIQQIVGAKTSDPITNSAIFFQTFYYGYGVIILGIVIYMFFRDRKRCFQDKISDTVVIKMVDINSKEEDKNKNLEKRKVVKNFGLPGEIKEGALEEIDSL